MGISRRDVQGRLFPGEQISCVVENVSCDWTRAGMYFYYPELPSTHDSVAAITSRRLIVGRPIKEGTEWLSVAGIQGVYEKPRRNFGKSWLQVTLLSNGFPAVRLCSREGDRAGAEALEELANRAFQSLAAAGPLNVAAHVVEIEEQDAD